MRGILSNFCSGRKAATDRNIKEILVIRIDRIGDLICTLPAIKTLRNYFHKANFTALLSNCNSSLITDTGLIDEIIVWHKHMTGTEKKGFIKNLKDRNFDLVLVFSPYTEAYEIAFKTGAPVRAGVVIKSRILTRFFAYFCLTHIFLLNQEEKLLKKEKVLHEAEKGFKLLEILGIKEFSRDMSLSLPGHILTEGREYLNSISMKDQKGIIGLPLCCRYKGAGWGSSEAGMLSEELRKKFPEYLLFITFGKEEEEEGKLLHKIFQNRDGIVVKGEISLQLWAFLIQNMSVVISIDSGAVHLASSRKIPSVVLYPKEIYELCRQEWAPWDAACRQIVIRDFRETAGEIITAVEELLSSEG